MKSVSIFGGGIGGLTAAHELSKLGYAVDVYERYDSVGGMARSLRDGQGCAMEYCWRVYFGFYDNLLKLLSEIPTDTGVVKNNLIVYKHTNFPSSNITDYSLTAMNQILKGITSCNERLEEMDNVKWHDAIGVSEGSKLFREIGPWLGMDRKKGSYNSVIRVGFEMQILPAFFSFGKYKDFVMNQPTSEGWFDWWVKDLQKRGVRFHMNSELEKVFVENSEIVGAVVNGNVVTSDYYILSIPVQELNRVVKVSGLKGLGSVDTLSKKCLHLQLSFQLFFNKEINLGGKNAFLLVNSPWDLIVLSYTDKGLCKDIPEVKGAWSIAVCTAYVKGYNGKTFKECNTDEIHMEIYNQIVKSKELMTCIESNNNFKFNRDLIVKWAPVWPTFNSDLNTSEPKFTNNAGSLALRPSYKTKYSNLFISTAYVKETIDIFSMEAACIAGKRVAHSIDEKASAPTTKDRTGYLLPFRAVDKVLYNLGLPNISFWIILILLVFTIYLIIKRRKLKIKNKN